MKRRSKRARRPAPPIKTKTDAIAGRNWLTEQEDKALIAAAKEVGRYFHCDSTMILLAFRHGLRCIEVVNLTWDQIHLDKAAIEMRRAKRGKPAMHELTKTEIRAIKKLPGAKTRKGWVFTTEDGGKLGERSFHLIVARAGKLADLGFPAHPHMLRHACGHYLAAKGLDTSAFRTILGTSRSSIP